MNLIENERDKTTFRSLGSIVAGSAAVTLRRYRGPLRN